MRRTLLYLVFGALPVAALAGELECMIGCDLDGLASGFTWKSTRCHKPSPPMMLFASDVRQYNNAVEEFNQWLSEVDAYLSCIREEAISDIKKAPDVIIEGAKQVQSEMRSEVQRQRTNLELMRP